MEENYKLVGNINLANLSNVGIMTVKGQTCSKKCLVIPLEENDVYVKVEEKTTADGRKYLSKKFCIGIEVYALREQDQYGNTHYVKASTSKSFINSHTPEELETRNKIYLGNLKPMAIPSSNQASTIDAPVADAVPGENDDLPF